MNKTLLLVDGSSYLYRAFHAMPDLRNAQGAPTGAIYGMINMLRRLRQDFPAAYIACVFDAKGQNLPRRLVSRIQGPAAVDAGRPGKQIAPIHEAVRALGWPILMVEGVEADDVIGTLAAQAAAQGMQTVVSTGDKDLAQLVNDQVTLINTMSNEKLDRAGVVAKFGVPPEQIVDYLSLVGDTVDNVPGVEKVGPKTAVKWLTQYGTLDEVVAHAAEVGGAVGENLRRALDWLPQARVLLTVKYRLRLVGPHAIEHRIAGAAAGRQGGDCWNCLRATASSRGCANTGGTPAAQQDAAASPAPEAAQQWRIVRRPGRADRHQLRNPPQHGAA